MDVKKKVVYIDLIHLIHFNPPVCRIKLVVNCV